MQDRLTLAGVPRQALTELLFDTQEKEPRWRTTASSISQSACSRSPSTRGSPRPDRATSSVEHGTDTGPKGEWRNEVWYQGSGAIGEKAVERIQIYPPTHGHADAGRRRGSR